MLTGEHSKGLRVSNFTFFKLWIVISDFNLFNNLVICACWKSKPLEQFIVLLFHHSCLTVNTSSSQADSDNHDPSFQNCLASSKLFKIQNRKSFLKQCWKVHAMFLSGLDVVFYKHSDIRFYKTVLRFRRATRPWNPLYRSIDIVS